jgi:hypothetical protein
LPLGEQLADVNEEVVVVGGVDDDAASGQPKAKS